MLRCWLLQSSLVPRLLSGVTLTRYGRVDWDMGRPEFGRLNVEIAKCMCSGGISEIGGARGEIPKGGERVPQLLASTRRTQLGVSARRCRPVLLGRSSRVVMPLRAGRDAPGCCETQAGREEPHSGKIGGSGLRGGSGAFPCHIPSPNTDRRGGSRSRRRSGSEVRSATSLARAGHHPGNRQTVLNIHKRGASGRHRYQIWPA